LADAGLHRFRKTYRRRCMRKNASVYIRIHSAARVKLGHESLDVTLAYLKGKDAESETAPEHANSSSLALYA
jgi:hypothetical protein